MMNELEKAIFDELQETEDFKSFFLKVSALQVHFNKHELKSLRKIIANEEFVEKYGWDALCYMNDNIHKERCLPFNNISEKTRIKRILDEYKEV